MPGNDLSVTRALVPVSATTRATARANITTILDNILNDIEPAVTPAGLDITSALSFLSGGVYSPATNLGYVNMEDRSTATGVASESLYVLGNELYFKDGSANLVAITSGGSITGTAGSITGSGYGTPVELAWDTGTAEYRFKSGSGTHALADIVLDKSRYSDGTTYYATLGAQAAMAATLDFSLPIAFPGSTSVMTLTSAGLMGSSRDLSIDTLLTTGVVTASGAVSGTTVTASSEMSCTDIVITGTREKWLNAVAGIISAGTLSGAVGTWQSAAASNFLHVPFPFDVNDRVGALRINWKPAAGGTTPIVVIVRKTDGDGTTTTLGTSSFTISVAGTWQTDVLSLTAHTMAVDESLVVECESGEIADIIQSIGISYTHV